MTRKGKKNKQKAQVQKDQPAKSNAEQVPPKPTIGTIEVSAFKAENSTPIKNLHLRADSKIPDKDSQKNISQATNDTVNNSMSSEKDGQEKNKNPEKAKFKKLNDPGETEQFKRHEDNISMALNDNLSQHISSNITDIISKIALPCPHLKGNTVYIGRKKGKEENEVDIDSILQSIDKDSQEICAKCIEKVVKRASDVVATILNKINTKKGKSSIQDKGKENYSDQGARPKVPQTSKEKINKEGERAKLDKESFSNPSFPQNSSLNPNEFFMEEWGAIIIYNLQAANKQKYILKAKEALMLLQFFRPPEYYKPNKENDSVLTIDTCGTSAFDLMNLFLKYDLMPYYFAPPDSEFYDLVIESFVVKRSPLRRGDVVPPFIKLLQQSVKTLSPPQRSKEQETINSAKQDASSKKTPAEKKHIDQAKPDCQDVLKNSESMSPVIPQNSEGTEGSETCAFQENSTAKLLTLKGPYFSKQQFQYKKQDAQHLKPTTPTEASGTLKTTTTAETSKESVLQMNVPQSPNIKPGIARATFLKGPSLCIQCKGLGCGATGGPCYAKKYVDVCELDPDLVNTPTENTPTDWGDDYIQDYFSDTEKLVEDVSRSVKRPPPSSTVIKKRRLPRPRLKAEMTMCLNCRKGLSELFVTCSHCERARYCEQSCSFEDHYRHNDECKRLKRWNDVCARLEPNVLQYLADEGVNLTTEFRQVPDCFQSFLGYRMSVICEVLGECYFYPSETIFSVIVQDESSHEVPLVISVDDAHFYSPATRQVQHLDKVLTAGRFIILINPVWVLFKDHRQGFKVTDLKSLLVIKEATAL